MKVKSGCPCPALKKTALEFAEHTSVHGVSYVAEKKVALSLKLFPSHQGGRTWQPFVGSKNGNENFRQARIYNFRVKCVVFARNRKFAKLTQ